MCTRQRRQTDDSRGNNLGLIIQIKTVQRLGRFVPFSEIPNVILQHIKDACRSRVSLQALRGYFSSGAKDRHIKLIRNYLGLKPYDSSMTSSLIREWAMEAAKTKEALPDVINVALEYLVKEKYEIPSYHTLFKICRAARATVNTEYYDQLAGYLSSEGHTLIKQLIEGNCGPNAFGWSALKNEPKRPTPKNIHAYINYLEWLNTLQQILPTDLGLPPTKHRQFINEAKALDHAELKKLKAKKRIAMVVVLIRHQYAQTLDNAAQIIIKILQKMDTTAQKHLEEYLVQHRRNTDKLIGVLSDTVKIYMDNPKSVSAFDASLGNNSKLLLQMCEQYMAYANNNYLPFMVRLYKKQRSSIFRAVEVLNLASASEDKSVLNALHFIIENRKRRTDTLCIEEEKRPAGKNKLNIRWIREKWWKLVTGKTSRTAKVTHVDRTCFELCVFERVAEELSTGDLYVPYSENFDDYREQFISWQEYEQDYQSYSDQVGIKAGTEAFTSQLFSDLVSACQKSDQQFPNDETVRIENSQLVIGKPKADGPCQAIEKLGTLLRDRLEKTNLLDVILSAEQWLDLHKHFGPLSGNESRVDDPFLRFVLTLFCYGTNIGPTETARSVKGISRKQIAWINLKRSTEERLDKAIAKVSNAYRKYNLIDCWGSGDSVSADGKLWDLYEDNLLSEYHLRYGSFGGIAYYHVSDTYIALFSRFIPCGVFRRAPK